MRLYVICSLLLGSAPLLCSVTDYLQGFLGGHFMLLLFPVSLYLLVTAFSCLLVLVATNARDFFKKCLSPRKLMLLATSIIVFVASWVVLPPPTSSFLKGFTQGIQRSLLFEDIMEIANIAQSQIPDGEVVWHPRKLVGGPEPDNIAKWKLLAAVSDISQLPGLFVVSNRDGIVEIEWGGALVGHWGFRFSDGDVHEDDRDYGYEQLRNNLAAFYTD